MFVLDIIVYMAVAAVVVAAGMVIAEALVFAFRGKRAGLLPAAHLLAILAALAASICTYLK